MLAATAIALAAVAVLAWLIGAPLLRERLFARDTDHDFQFYEWRAMNEGFRRRMFTDIEAAIAWLDWMPER